eukprot:12131623-Alexandrium_andersonii.AAC.1
MALLAQPAVGSPELLDRLSDSRAKNFKIVVAGVPNGALSKMLEIVVVERSHGLLALERPTVRLHAGATPAGAGLAFGD